MKIYNPDKCSSFEMMFGFPQTLPIKKRKKAKKKKSE